MASNNAPRDPRQFPWTAEGQAARADFGDYLRRAHEDRILEEILDLKRQTEQVLQQHQSQSSLMLASTELMRELVIAQQWFRSHVPGFGRRSKLNQQTEPEPSYAHMPQNRDWRTWPGFKGDMQAREQEIRNVAAELGTIPNTSKENLAGQRGGDSVKSISRTMVDTYGLDVERDWPPSLWPERPPKTPVFRVPNGHSLSVAMAGLLGWAILDLFSDGRYDHVVRMIRFVGCHVGLPT